jgi:hypothetical protein
MRVRCDCDAMRERCDFHRSTIAIGNASIYYIVFIPLSEHRSVIAAAHAHRSPNWKLSFTGILLMLFDYLEPFREFLCRK